MGTAGGEAQSVGATNSHRDDHRRGPPALSSRCRVLNLLRPREDDRGERAALRKLSAAYDERALELCCLSLYVNS